MKLNPPQEGLVSRAPATLRSSETPNERAMHAIVRNDLQSAVVNAHRQAGAHLRAELAAPGEMDLGTKIDNGFSRILIGHAVERILALGFACDDGLQGERVLVVERKVKARSARPRQVIGVLVPEIAFRP